MAGGSLVVDRARCALYTSATAALTVQPSPSQDRAIPCDTISTDGRAALPERLYTMTYRRPGFAEPLASARHGRSKSVAKAQKTASTSQL
jgi:hypothetical protein